MASRNSRSQYLKCESLCSALIGRSICDMRLCKTRWACCLLLPSLGVALGAQQKPDLTKHTVRMVSVEKGVSLEVLDWGGNGRPLVLLTGLADDAHISTSSLRSLRRNITFTASLVVAGASPVRLTLKDGTIPLTGWEKMYCPSLTPCISTNP